VPIAVDAKRLAQALARVSETFQEFSRHGNTIVEVTATAMDNARIVYNLRIATCQRQGCPVGGAVLAIEETQDDTVFPPYRYRANIGLIP
jgi:hypothetical protein